MNIQLIQVNIPADVLHLYDRYSFSTITISSEESRKSNVGQMEKNSRTVVDINSTIGRDLWNWRWKKMQKMSSEETNKERGDSTGSIEALSSDICWQLSNTNNETMLLHVFDYVRRRLLYRMVSEWDDERRNIEDRFIRVDSRRPLFLELLFVTNHNPFLYICLLFKSTVSK